MKYDKAASTKDISIQGLSIIYPDDFDLLRKIVLAKPRSKNC